MFIQYTPTREIAGGPGEISATTQPGTEPTLDPVGEESVSLSGVGRESVLHRLERQWQVNAGPEDLTTEAKWREFYASTANGETFTIDLFGTQASPVNPITVSMVRKSAKESRPWPLQKQYNFRVVER